MFQTSEAEEDDDVLDEMVLVVVIVLIPEEVEGLTSRGRADLVDVVVVFAGVIDNVLGCANGFEERSRASVVLAWRIVLVFIFFFNNAALVAARFLRAATSMSVGFLGGVKPVLVRGGCTGLTTVDEPSTARFLQPCFFLCLVPSALRSILLLKFGDVSYNTFWCTHDEPSWLKGVLCYSMIYNCFYLNNEQVFEDFWKITRLGPGTGPGIYI